MLPIRLQLVWKFQDISSNTSQEVGCVFSLYANNRVTKKEADVCENEKNDGLT